MNDFGSTKTRTSPNWKIRRARRLGIEPDVVAQTEHPATLHAQAQPALSGEMPSLTMAVRTLASACPD